MLVTTLLASIPATLPPRQDEELFSFWIADLETFFADPKDAGLLRALQLVDDRILELPGELPGFQIPVPPELFRLGLHAITGEKSLRVLSTTDTDLMFPVYGQLELMEGDEQKAREIADIVVGLAQEAGAPLGAPRSDGLVLLEGAPVPIVMGAHGGNVILSAGKVIDTPIDLSDTGLPAGVSPSMAVHVDLGAMIEMFGMMAGNADPDAALMFDMMSQIGLDDFELDMATGSDAERSYTSIRMPRYGGQMRANGLLPTRGLTHADMALVPADAVWASVGTTNFQGTLDYILAMMEEPLAQMGMGLLDTIMAGRYSAVDLAGVALGSSILWPLMLLVMGLIQAITPTVSQLNGARNYKEIGEVVRQGLWIAAIGGLLMSFILNQIGFVYALLDVDPKASPISIAYLQMTSLGMPAVTCFFLLEISC